MADERKNTISDVAALAGVSVGTVSNVINGKIVVSEARRQRVLKAIGELGYTQNMLAMGLRRRRSPVVGICVPSTTIPHFTALMEAFEEVASKQGFEIMQVLSKEDPTIEYQRIESLLRFRVGGLLIVPTTEPSATYALIGRSSLPTVIIERAPEANVAFDRVTFDNRGAMISVGHGLIERGHRDLLFVVREIAMNVNQRRIDGLNAAIAASGSEARYRLMEVREADEPTYTAMLAAELQRAPRPTAVIVSNCIFSHWTLRAFRAIDIRCPDDVSLVSFEQSDWDDVACPPVSAVIRPNHEIARTAWTFLMRRMNDEHEPIHRLELKAEVKFRDSVRNLLRPGKV
jgi:LacI family transcriptional regulator